MTEIDELSSEIADIRDLVRIAASDSVETRNLLKSQTQLINPLRETEIEISDTLGRHAAVIGHQGHAIGSMVLAVNELQIRVGSLDQNLLDFRRSVDRRFKGVEREIGSLKKEMQEVRSDTTAILRHLGIISDERT
jgi:hypothetical protein